MSTGGGYDVEYPSDWHRGGGCGFFDPEPFTVPRDSDFTGTALEVHALEESFDDSLASLIDRRFARTERREQLTVSGRRTFRLELVATGEGLLDRGTRTYAYLVGHGGGAILVQTTARPGTQLRHRSVVDRAARTLGLFQGAKPKLVGVPAAVAETHAAILAALDDGRLGTVASLADPDEFTYTFGGPVEGGPAAYWRELEREGTPVRELLGRILRLPYTLSRGIYVWPFAYDKTADQLTEHERELLQPLGPAFVGESYLGWRAGIRPDGRWIFFVAGD